jgi:hypothetical protein
MGAQPMNIVPTERDSPLKSTNKALVVLDTFDGKFFRGIEFRMVIFIDWRGPFIG